MAKPAKNSLTLPDHVFELLAAADQKHGFTPGTMQSLLQQESGGQDKYLNDTTTYHYPLNADGRRIAGSTGKISTAFGPLGILESTAKDPGYGVKPMGDKTDIGEHIRFGSDLLGALIKKGGSVKAGLDLYGSGPGSGYGDKVLARLPAGTYVAPQTTLAASDVPARVTPAAPVVLAQANTEQVPVQPPVQSPPPQVPGTPETVASSGGNEWVDYLNKLHQTQTQQPVQVADLGYGAQPKEQPKEQPMPVVQRPDFMAALGLLGQGQDARPDFRGFAGFGGRRA